MGKADTKFLGLLFLGGVAVYALAKLANNPKLNPNLRLLASTAEGDLVQDITTGFISLV